MRVARVCLHLLFRLIALGLDCLPLVVLVNFQLNCSSLCNLCLFTQSQFVVVVVDFLDVVVLIASFVFLLRLRLVVGRSCKLFSIANSDVTAHRMHNSRTN